MGIIYTQAGSHIPAVDKMQLVDTVTFTAAGWTGSEAPYTQTVSLARITSTDTPIVSLYIPSSVASIDDYTEAYGMISKVETGTGTLTATCLSEKPTLDVQVQVKGI